MSAIISKGGRKDHSSPGLYLQISADDVRIYSGAYQLEKEALYNVRTGIAADLSGFKKLISRKAFIDKFGEVHGDKNKIIPREFREAAQKQPLIYNKNFYYFAKFKTSEATKADFQKIIMNHYKVARPLNDFFEKAMKG